MNILFICKYNRFRSKIAEACFNKINKNKKIKVKSAGIIQGFPVNPNVISIAKEFGLKINPHPHGISSKLLKWQDKIIVVADDVPIQILNKYKKEIIVWKIKDTKEDNKEAIRKIIKSIFIHVDKLNF